MAKYRQVHTHIWKDNWFLELDPAHKLFFIYLFTNERASISGIYELSKRVMSFESGLTFGDIDAAFEIFSQAEKAYYEDGIVLVVNLRKYHETKSPKVQTAIMSDFDSIKDCRLKGMYMEIYGIDRVSGIENTVGIPRSSSSSSISSSSNGAEPEEKAHYELPEDAEPFSDGNEKRQEMVTAISGVVRETCAIGVTEDKFNQAADAFIADGLTTDDVKHFSDWWSKQDDRPYTGKPWLKSLVQNIKESLSTGSGWEDWLSDAKDFRNSS